MVGDDHARLAAAVDQLRQFTRDAEASVNEVSGIADRQLRVTSLTVLSTRQRRTQANWSCTKSSEQRAFGRVLTRIAARGPTTRRRGRLRTASLIPDGSPSRMSRMNSRR